MSELHGGPAVCRVLPVPYVGGWFRHLGCEEEGQLETSASAFLGSTLSGFFDDSEPGWCLVTMGHNTHHPFLSRYLSHIGALMGP